MLWLCATLPDLGLEIFTRANRHPPSESGGVSDKTGDGPVVLIEDNVIVNCNAEAAAIGIVAGGSLATAHSIDSSISHAVRDPAREAKRLQFLAECFQRFSPEVSVHPHEAIRWTGPRDGSGVTPALLLEISRSTRLFNGVDVLLRRIEAMAGDTGHRIRTGLAKTPLAALALARSGFQRVSADGLNSCEAEPGDAPSVQSATLPGPVHSRSAPSGLRRMQHRARHHNPLYDVPLSVSELAANDVQSLADMGIHTLGALLALPRDELGARFGKEPVRYLDRLTGACPHPLDSISARPDFSTHLHLADPIRDKQFLLPCMQQLLVELGEWLITRQLGTDRLYWRFSPHARSSSVVMPVSFAKPLQNVQRFMSISELKLARIDLPDEVLSLELHCRRPAPWSGASSTLFAPGVLPAGATSGDQAGANPELDELLDQLTARLQSHSLFGIDSSDDRRPEHAWIKTRPLVRPGGQTDVQSSTRRPLWLFNEPLRVPRRSLQLLQGPERIHSGWWHDSVQRDYYIARHLPRGLNQPGGGAQCWAFVDTCAAGDSGNPSLDSAPRSICGAETGAPSSGDQIHGDSGQEWFIHGYFG